MKKGMRQPPLAPWLLALLATAVAVVVMALYVGSRLPGDGSAEAGFARDMIVHHAQAVEMAEIVRDKTENEEVRTLASDIALTQQAQIGQMQGWLNVWGRPVTGTEPAMSWMGMPTEGRMPSMASPEAIRELGELPPEEADRQFLRLMIPHHRAALGMTGAVLEETDRPEVERLAGAISASQKAEISTMEEMLRKMGGEAPSRGGPPGRDGMDGMKGMEHGS